MTVTVILEAISTVRKIYFKKNKIIHTFFSVIPMFGITFSTVHDIRT
jgi:hypothetical protein